MTEEENTQENVSIFSDFDITKIQKERKKEKTVKKKLDVVRKLYHKTK